MNQELIPLAVAIALAAAVFLAARSSQSAVRGGVVPIALAAAAGLAIAIPTLDRPGRLPESEVTGRPIRVEGRGYVSSTACRACHAREYATWHESYHRQMTQIADPENAIADWDEVTLERHGETFELLRRDGDLWIRMRNPLDPSGGRVDRRVTMTTGAHHMQLYWFESGFGRVIGLLPFAFLRDEARWIPRASAFLLPPSEEVSTELGAWNQTCLRCHGTGPRARIDIDSSGLRGADTMVGEHGIACEACHGPADAHVTANQNPLRRYAQHLSDAADPTMVNPAELPTNRGSQVCGQCHANFDDRRSGKELEEWIENGFAYRPGDDLAETRELLADGGDSQYWPDGVIRVSGREYNGLVATPCHQAGEMSCFSCHVLHQPADDSRTAEEWAEDQLKEGMRGDRACLQCHESFAEDVSAHTHHAQGSTGSSCYDCHMPYTSYGLLKSIRNHHLSNPDAQNTLATGRPNACNLCHLDRSIRWTAERLEDWYGIAPPTPAELEGAEVVPGVSAIVELALSGDAAQRALAAWSLGWPTAHGPSGHHWIAPYLIHLLDDPYDAVRIIALRSLRRLHGFESFEFDELADEDERRAGQDLAREIWRSSGSASRPAGASVLLLPDGSIDSDAFQRLTARRDDRPVSLLE